jgi:hypothetical protein
MSAALQSDSYRRSFNAWLRTGRWLEVPEHKQNGGNPNHDPENGQFTFGPSGPAHDAVRPESARPLPNHPARPATPPAPKPAKASPRNIAHGTNASAGQIAAEHIAVNVIATRLNGIGLTPAARDQLDKFISGKRNPGDNMIYSIGSDGSNEMRDSLYAAGLNIHVQKEIADRNGGVIPDGHYLELTNQDIDDGLDKRSDRNNKFMYFRSAGALEFILSLAPKVTLADVVGSFSDRIEVHAKNGILTYKGVNQTTLGSFAENNFRHHFGGQKIQDAKTGSGSLGTVQQTIYFQFPIKRKYTRN